MKAYNKRLNHITTIKMIDFESGKVRLVMPESSPLFIYNEKLSNIEILDTTNVFLSGVEIFAGDKVSDGKDTYIGKKQPGGYFPFVNPVSKNFKKVD
jgi:hypothetical protein